MVILLDVLTLFQTRNSRHFQIKVVSRSKFIILIKKGSDFSKRLENTVGTGEIARYEQFLLFLQCFQKTCYADM